MRYYAVIDTNVLVSAFLKLNSIPDEVLQLALDGPIIPLLNIDILDEYKEVLLRDKFSFDKNIIETFLIELSKRAIFLDRTIVNEMFIDKDDAVFYEIVMSARNSTDAYLITGNTKHFPKEPFIVTPREMLDIINNAGNK